MRVNREEWAERVERWKDSGLSAKEFGAELGINPRTLVRPDAARAYALLRLDRSNVVGEHEDPFRCRQAGAGKAHTIMRSGSSRSQPGRQASPPRLRITPDSHNGACRQAPCRGRSERRRNHDTGSSTV